MDTNISFNWGLLGHDWAVDMLKEHIRRESVRHAYLFCGPSGIGRRTLALRFAQALNCPNQKEPGQPCGKCKTCQQIERPLLRAYASADERRRARHGVLPSVSSRDSANPRDR